MKISQELIIRELISVSGEYAFCYSEGINFSAMELSGICSIDEKTEVRNDTLYLVANGAWVLQNSICIQRLKNSNSVICCLSNHEAEFEQLQIPYICFIRKQTGTEKFSERHSYNHIFHIIYNIFQKFETWQTNLYLAVENDDIQEMLDASVDIFSKTIYIADREQEYLAASGPCLDYKGRGSQVPLEVFNYLKNDVNNKHPLLEQEPFLYPAGILNSDSLCKDIFVNGEFFCRIIIIDEINNSSFNKADYILMDILSKALQFLINQNDPSLPKNKDHSGNSIGLIDLINQLLNNMKIEKSQLNSVLIRNGWQKNEGCYIGYLWLYPSEIRVKSPQYYCRYISEQFKGVYAIERNDHLILMIRESSYLSLDKFLSEFILFIRDCNFRLGVSNLCIDLMQIPFYYRQSEIAMNDGLQRNKTIWSHKFSNCAFAYLLQEACHEMPADLLCAPELLILHSYDKKNKTEYYNTLQSYLDNRMNATKTAKQLFIHQATMVYRLKRLKELTNIDFEDTDKLLYLHLSYKILETE